MLAAERQRFLDDYLRIRRAEGRGSDDPAYYFALPYRDLSGALISSGTCAAARIDISSARSCGRSSAGVRSICSIWARAADGCRTGWRCAGTGRSPWIFSTDRSRRAGRRAALFRTRSLASRDSTPSSISFRFADASFDAVIYNASLHYSSDYFKNAGARRGDVCGRAADL